MALTLPIIIDKWSPNEDIAKLRDVLAVNSLVRYESLEYAYNKPLTEQDWFYTLLYDTGLYPVFAVFNVQRTDLESIMALVNYNYSPTRPNLINLLNNVLPSGTTYTITEGVGEVDIVIVNDNLDAPYPIVQARDSNAGDSNINVDDALNDWIEIPSVDFVWSLQDLFILKVYVACGVKLNVSLTNSAKKIKKVKNLKGK